MCTITIEEMEEDCALYGYPKTRKALEQYELGRITWHQLLRVYLKETDENPLLDYRSDEFQNER